MMVKSPQVELPIHFFWPLRIQESPSRFAVVARPPDAPEPTSGSVKPNEPTFSNRAMGGSQRSFCSSEPQTSIDPIARPVCTPKKVEMDASTRANSIMRNPIIVVLLPGQPYPLIGSPAIPSDLNFGNSSNGNSSRLQKSLITGCTSVSMNARTLSRNELSSLDRVFESR